MSAADQIMAETLNRKVRNNDVAYLAGYITQLEWSQEDARLELARESIRPAAYVPADAAALTMSPERFRAWANSTPGDGGQENRPYRNELAPADPFANLPGAGHELCAACGDYDHRPATFRGGHFYTTAMNSREG